jgi:ATP-binding cassette, subfamily B, multidrug efflux pump
MDAIKELLKYFKKYKKKLILGIFFIIFSNIAQVYVPILLKDSINALQTHVTSAMLLKYGILILVAALISGVFRFYIRQTIIVISREIEYDLREEFWEHIQKLPLRYFQNNSTGNIMALATNDISAVRMFFGPAVMYSIDTITTMIIVISLMVAISPALTFFSLAPLPFLSYFIYRVSRKIHKKFTLIQEKFSEITTKAQENFSGIRVVKSYVREDYEIEQFKKLGNEYLFRQMDKIKIQALFQPILYLIAGVSAIIVVSVGGMMVIRGQLTLGDISAFVIYLGLMIWPVIAFGWVANIIQQSEASMKRLISVLNEEPEIEDSANTDNSLTNVEGEIEFRNVSFKYKNDLPYVLDNISIKIDKGSTVAFIGHTGVGKSSLINLIPRLYDVTGGELLVDGQNVKNYPLKVLRKNVGLVPQETFLFSETLSNNILYGIQSEDKELVDRVADIAGLKKDVESFPDGFETILGERGITLSGGQKQRATLARALAINPKILILDDSFSAVDTHTEEQILIKLKQFMKDRTSIIISHRISTVKDADRIFVLDKGKIAEQGTHQQLIELHGIYADIHQKQLLEEELKEI